MNKELRIV